VTFKKYRISQYWYKFGRAIIWCNLGDLSLIVVLCASLTIIYRVSGATWRGDICFSWL